jgi:hypothetical protein
MYLSQRINKAKVKKETQTKVTLSEKLHRNCPRIQNIPLEVIKNDCPSNESFPDNYDSEAKAQLDDLTDSGKNHIHFRKKRISKSVSLI